ncbi:MAG: tRNA (adenine(22)-N(1))-methyltransferase TrmK [Bdellovibrionota bacterium]|nr:MAG: tRNA (adenine(22)-N(1))-methyltransferase TrmK [Bdellovibrionota bacterium]
MRSEKADEILARTRAAAGHPYDVTLKGITVGVVRGVYPTSELSTLVVECLEDPKIGLMAGERMLDYGTGVGYLAIAGAQRGAFVVATDINAAATECARSNVARARLSDRVDVRQGPEFSTLRPGEKFDVITAGMPFEDAEVRDPLERAVYDPGFVMRRALFEHAREHLTPSGRIFTTYSERVQLVRPLENFDPSYNYQIVRDRMIKGERNFVFMITP